MSRRGGDNPTAALSVDSAFGLRCTTPADRLRTAFRDYQSPDAPSPLAQLQMRTHERRLRAPQGEWVERVSSLMPLRDVASVSPRQ